MNPEHTLPVPVLLPPVAPSPASLEAAPRPAPPTTPSVATARFDEAFTPGALSVLDDLLRAPDRLTARLASPLRLETVRVLLLTMLTGAAVFGATLGIHRSLLQMGFASLKLPLVCLVLAITVLPAVVGLRRAAKAAGSALTDAGHVLSVFALGSLVLAATAPLTVLGVLAEFGYHRMVLLSTFCVTVAGLVSLHRLGTLLEVQNTGLAVIAGACAVVALVGAQVTWTLRPFIARPSVDVVFLREDPQDLFESLGRTFDSSRGVFHRRSAESADWSD